MKKKNKAEYYTFAYKTPLNSCLEGKIVYGHSYKIDGLLKDIKEQLARKQISDYQIIKILNPKGFVIWMSSDGKPVVKTESGSVG